MIIKDTIIEIFTELFPSEDISKYEISSLLRKKIEVIEDSNIKKYLQLCTNIMDLNFSPKSKNAYTPKIIFNDGSTSFNLSDLSNEDWIIITQIVNWIPLLHLKARIYDLLWINKNNYQYAEQAIIQTINQQQV